MIARRIKDRKNFRNRSWGVTTTTLYQKVEIFDIFGAAFPPPVAIEVKFCTAKRTHVPVGSAQFGVNRCNQSLLRGENLIFGL